MDSMDLLMVIIGGVLGESCFSGVGLRGMSTGHGEVKDTREDSGSIFASVLTKYTVQRASALFFCNKR
jgi:hypothetical protein